jgi:DNA polymerase III alpha subunit (gram-positive type)
MNYLFFDCETGGIDEHRESLLTAYFVAYSPSWEKLGDIELFLKPDDGQIVAEQEALDVTGINIEEHLKDPRTVTYSEGAKQLKEFLEQFKIKGKRSHYRPCGQNVGFDIRFVNAKLIPQEEWKKLVHYRPLDTLQILTFLQDVEFLPKDLGNLSSQVEYFNIPKGQAHDAKEDIRMTVDVYRAYCKLMQDKKDNMAGVTGNSLLEIVER